MFINEKIDKILKSQRDYFDANNTLILEKRIQWLRDLKQSIKKNENKLLNAVKADLGRDPQITKRFELDLIYREIDEFIEKLPEWSQDTKVESTQYIKDTGHENASIIHIPHGQVYLIVPFNFPINLGIQPLLGAIAAGNVVFYKMSKLTPNTNMAVKEVLSIFPPELVYFLDINLSKEEVDKLNDYAWDFIFFTGSTSIGTKIYSHQFDKFTPAVFELGGKSPMIIDKTADLKLAARKLLTTKLINSGQICVAVDYLIIHKSIEVDFNNTLKEIYTTEFANNPLYISNLISKEKSDEVNSWIKNEDSSKFIINEQHNIKGYDELKFAFIPYSDVTDKKYLDNELFSPISYYYTFNDIQDIIKIIKTHNYPLAFYCFSDNKELINYLKYHTQSGSFVVNDVLIQVSHGNLPFGGIRTSGLGRYHGKFSFETFSINKPCID